MKILLLIALLMVLVSSCSTIGVKEELDETVKAYGIAVRWKNLETADLFADSSIREKFQKQVEKMANVQVFDYRIVNVEYDETMKKATVNTEISYYLLTSNRAGTLVDKQIWLYGGEKGSRGWHLMTLLPEFK
jgi:hypothetical protein